jgi:hypothetical protein
MWRQLHIYGPDAHHDDQFIVGDIEALKSLRDALIQLIDKSCDKVEEYNPNVVLMGTRRHEAHGENVELIDGWKEEDDCFGVNDGEGFDLYLIRLDGKEEWKKLAVPYQLDYCREMSEDALWPWKLVVSKKVDKNE